MRRWMGVALAILAALAASSWAEGDKEAAAPAAQGVVTLKWLCHRPPTGLNSITQQYMEQRFNVKLDIWQLAPTGGAEWAQQVNLKLAAGEIPDMFWIWSNADVDAYARQGVLSEIPRTEIEQKMPYYAQSMTKIEPGLWNTGTSQGKRYAIPVYFPLGGHPRQPAFNKNWLVKAGFTRAPETLADLEKALLYFANGDPDGNGKKDTFGYSAQFQTPVVSFQSVFGAFGVLPASWLTVDGKVVFGMTTERAREGFKLLAKWYKAGVIDPEFIVTDWTKVQQDFTQQRVGMMDSQRWDGLTPDRPITKTLREAGNDVVVGGAFTGPGGKGVLQAWGVYNNFVGFGVQLAKDTVKRNRLFQILDVLSSDEAAYLRTQFGVEGVHYDMVDGVPKYKAEWADATKQVNELGLGDYFNPFKNKSEKMQKFMFTKAQLEYRDTVARALEQKVLPDKSWEVVVPEIQKYPDLGKLQNEYFVKFITGEVDLAKGFDDFVALWKRSGGTEITDGMNRAFSLIK